MIPLAEALLRPALTLALAFLVPLAIRQLTRLVERSDDDRHAPFLAQALLVELAFAGGFTALGPRFVLERASAPSLLFAIATATLTLFALVPRSARKAARAGLLFLLVAGTAGAVSLAFLAPIVPWPVATGAIGAIAALYLDRAEIETAPLRLIITALTLAPWSLALALWLGTEISSIETADVSSLHARWRHRVAPLDPNAMLALGWDARRRDVFEVAEQHVELARELGVEDLPFFQFSAELAAARGDCSSARTAFNAMLAAQAEQAFESDLMEERLNLGFDLLPPTFVEQCALEDPDE